MPLNIEVTQFPNGIGTVKDNSVLSSLPLPTPAVDLGFDDCGAASLLDLIATGTVIGAGAVLSQLAGFASGVRRYTTAGADGDGLAIGFDQATAAPDNMVVNAAPVWFGLRFRVDDPVEFTLLAGFFPDASALAPTDGIFLRCADATGVLEIVSVAAAAAESATALGTLQADTWYEAAFYYDGIDKVAAQFSGPDGVIGGGGNVIPGANLTAIQVQPSINFAAGEAVAKNFDLDWVLFGGAR